MFIHISTYIGIENHFRYKKWITYQIYRGKKITIRNIMKHNFKTCFLQKKTYLHLQY